MFDMCGDVQQVFNGHLVSTPYVIPNDDGGDFLEAQDRGCFREVEEPSLTDNRGIFASGTNKDHSVDCVADVPSRDVTSHDNNEQFFLHLKHRGVSRHSRHLRSDALAVTCYNKSVAKNGKRVCKHPQFFNHLRIQ